MSEFFTLSVLIATFASAVRFAVPYLLAALGETIGQRSGVLNLGVDGVMLLSAFGAYYTVVETGSHLFGIGVGLLIGLFMGLVYAVVTVNLHAQQGISGIGIFLFGLGFSDLLSQELVGAIQPIRKLPSLAKLPLVGGIFEPLEDIKYLGELLFSHNLMTYIAFALVPLVTWMMNNTTFGLNIKAVGENPQAADSLGVSVERTRFFAILIGNTLAGTRRRNPVAPARCVPTEPHQWAWFHCCRARLLRSVAGQVGYGGSHALRHRDCYSAAMAGSRHHPELCL